MTNYAQNVVSQIPTTSADVAVQNYWRGILPNPNDTAEQRTKKSYKISDRLKRGVPNLMMVPLQNQPRQNILTICDGEVQATEAAKRADLQSQNNLITNFNRVGRLAALNALNAARPEPETPQWTITSREDWGATHPRNHPNWVNVPNVANWGTGGLGTPKGIVFHHTANDDFRMYENHHFGRCTPYHFIIDSYGGIFEGRPRGYLGDHVGGANTGRIGIAFTGNFEKEGTAPTPDALAAAEWLVSFLTYQYPGIHEFRPHSDFDGWRSNGDFASNQYMRDWIKAFNLNEEE